MCIFFPLTLYDEIKLLALRAFANFVLISFTGILGLPCMEMRAYTSGNFESCLTSALVGQI